MSSLRSIIASIVFASLGGALAIWSSTTVLKMVRSQANLNESKVQNQKTLASSSGNVPRSGNAPPTGSNVPVNSGLPRAAPVAAVAPPPASSGAALTAPMTAPMTAPPVSGQGVPPISGAGAGLATTGAPPPPAAPPGQAPSFAPAVSGTNLEGGNNSSALEQPMAPVGPLDDAENLSLENYQYEPIGKRDPFNPFYLDSTAHPKESVINSPLQNSPPPGIDNYPGAPPPPGGPENPASPDAVTVSNVLLQFSVEEFKVRGILWGVKEPKALISLPNNKTYYVKKLTKVGRNNGYISTIREGEVVIVEKDLNGKFVSKVLILKNK